MNHELTTLQIPGYSEDFGCREREDALDEFEWALEDALNSTEEPSGVPQIKHLPDFRP